MSETVKIEGWTRLRDALNRLQTAFIRQANKYPREIARAWRRSIVAQGAVDTESYLRAVDFRETLKSDDFRAFVVDTAKNPLVTYDALVEAVDTAKIPARYPALKGLQQANVENVSDEIVGQTLKR